MNQIYHTFISGQDNPTTHQKTRKLSLLAHHSSTKCGSREKIIPGENFLLGHLQGG